MKTTYEFAEEWRDEEFQELRGGAKAASLRRLSQALRDGLASGQLVEDQFDVENGFNHAYEADCSATRLDPPAWFRR